MTEKLKPEHRKLWRRIYLLEYEQERQTAEESQEAADKVVAQWEARGAFDDIVEPATSTSTTPQTAPAEKPFTVRFPNAFASIWSDIRKHDLGADLVYVGCDDRDAFGISAVTPRGERLLRIGYKEGAAAMIAAMESA